MRLDEGSRELLAQDEMLLQQGFAHVTSNHPDLWFDVGLRYRSLKYGTLGLAMMTAGTLAQALEVACRYQALTYSLIDYRYVSAPNGSCALLGDTGGIPADLHDFTQHRDLGAIKTLIDDLTAGEPVLERITVSAPPPAIGKRSGGRSAARWNFTPIARRGFSGPVPQAGRCRSATSRCWRCTARVATNCSITRAAPCRSPSG
ncbi:AraC family transcriptional regulator ligand-binding domain-containing protein [Novosphingobium colocasiae]